jgi:GNAT superfamily N-acetyltransferase
MTTAIEPVRLAEQQIGEAAEALARAFFDDPLFTYVFPDDELRGRVLPQFMAAGARMGHLFGEVYTGAESVVGAAIWLPPNWGEFNDERTAAAGFPAVMKQMGEEANARFGVAMGEFGALHQRDMPAPHWYLMILGVDPPRQGIGIGGQLIQPVLARADSDGVACYLETLKARNVPFYQRHGFKVLVEGDLPDGPHYWTMRREPR